MQQEPKQLEPIDAARVTVPGRIVVAMSGGVDSSVVAALMAEQGLDVVGITLQLYDHGEAVGRKGSCCAGQDIMDARNVADKIGIPHYVLNYESLFRQEVIDAFADSYLRGETPIPCVKCNQSVKFRDLLAVAHDLGASAMATGHYVQRIDGPNGAELHRGQDDDKDQSYFLFATTQQQLDYLRFPLGGMTKQEVRAHAERLNLPVAQKPDSQDICFVPGGNYAKVIEKLRPEGVEPGDIMHVDGTVLGRHEGIIHYTVGQRRGIGIAHPEPLYVVRVDAAKRQVVVGPKEALLGAWLTLTELNWLDAPLPENGREVTVKLRSAQAALDATIYPFSKGRALVRLNSPEHAITPGQACVVYQGDRVLGGGWITQDHKNYATPEEINS